MVNVILVLDPVIRNRSGRNPFYLFLKIKSVIMSLLSIYVQVDWPRLLIPVFCFLLTVNSFSWMVTAYLFQYGFGWGHVCIFQQRANPANLLITASSHDEYVPSPASSHEVYEPSPQSSLSLGSQSQQQQARSVLLFSEIFNPDPDQF